MVHVLQAGYPEAAVLYKLGTYLSASVVVIDGPGYQPLDQASANWTFQVVSRRADRALIILASNGGLGAQGEVPADPVVAGGRS